LPDDKQRVTGEGERVVCRVPRQRRHAASHRQLPLRHTTLLGAKGVVNWGRVAHATHLIPPTSCHTPRIMPIQDKVRQAGCGDEVMSHATL
jgi:hypothetical protein